MRRAASLRPSITIKFTLLVLILLTSAAAGMASERIVANAIAILGMWVAATGVALVFVYYRFVIRAKQRGMNARAAELVKSERYFLYLRPFATSKRVIIKNGLASYLDRLVVGSSWDIELSLSTALDSLGPIVAIGDKSSSLGAAKFSVPDAQWQSLFHRLTAGAARIFVVPHASGSLLWEIEQLCADQNLSAKTFFLMPPREYGLWRRLVGIARGTARQRWQEALTALSERGIVLPSHRKQGMIFQIGSRGEPDGVLPFNELRPAYLAAVAKGDTARVRSYRLRRVWHDWLPLWFVGPIFKPGFVFAASLVLIALIPVRTFVYGLYSIQSGATEPTLSQGDRVLVSYLTYGTLRLPNPLPNPKHPDLFSITLFTVQPERGDMVIFRRSDGFFYAMRVVGLPSDEIFLEDGVLHINGKPVPKRPAGTFAERREGHVTQIRMFEETLPNGVTHNVLDAIESGPYDNTATYRVPPGHFFVMGDNRDNSTDSRVASVGYISGDDILGRIDRIVYSTGEPAPFPWIRWDRLLARVR